MGMADQRRKFSFKWRRVCLIVCMYGVQGIYGVQGVHMGRKLAMKGAVDRRADEHPKNNNSGTRQMHNKEETKTQSHLMRFVDLI